MPSTRSRTKTAAQPTATADASLNPSARQGCTRPKKQAAKIANIPSTEQSAEQQPVDNPEPVVSESPFEPLPGVGGASFTPEATSSPVNESNGSVANPASHSQLSDAYGEVEAWPIPFPYPQNPILSGSHTLTAGSDTQANEKRKSQEIELLEPTLNPPKRHKTGTDGNDLLIQFERLKNQHSSTGKLRIARLPLRALSP
ncbi:hypothetical protein M422DRAFT_53580 [Sphaerobolus stellatus SS14]|uniref:Uncharacterized protein n=1 Tax=Sphaerobolus stellatus (strain SS14) TaxID=990650 RepID=A0A0C9UZY7_SPHS4|nr:hypothetical protein M422DRAFT_53580 [Sphaerobolus stellatus SS14]